MPKTRKPTPIPPDAAQPQLPHERDQAFGQTAAEPDPVIEQAAKDLADGQVDTDMRSTPGLDAQQRERLVRPPPRAKP